MIESIFKKHGLLTQGSTNKIVDPQLPVRKEKCKHCGNVVKAIFKWGYGHNQIMAFFDCDKCHSKWHFDLMKKENMERLQREGLFDRNRKPTSKFFEKTKQWEIKKCQSVI